MGPNTIFPRKSCSFPPEIILLHLLASPGADPALQFGVKPYNTLQIAIFAPILGSIRYLPPTTPVKVFILGPYFSYSALQCWPMAYHSHNPGSNRTKNTVFIPLQRQHQVIPGAFQCPNTHLDAEESSAGWCMAARSTAPGTLRSPPAPLQPPGSGRAEIPRKAPEPRSHPLHTRLLSFCSSSSAWPGPYLGTGPC